MTQSGDLDKWLWRLTVLACAWTLVVIVLGAYVRLSHAGLGCPDWPGCYGHYVVPEAAEHIDRANQVYPERPLEAGKAWKEMVHRYFAGGLGLLVLAIAVLAVIRHGHSKAVIIPVCLLGLIVFQALLGMWTVTWLLKPLVVTAHLLGGMTTLALLCWLAMRYWDRAAPGTSSSARLRPLVVTALLVVGLQIALGGWTSSNYAAVACYGFPQCNGQWWPAMNFSDAFVLWHGLGIDYEGGILDNPARVAVHMSHRLGAVVVLAVLSWLAASLWRRAKSAELKGFALAMAILTVVQLVLGVANVTLGLPLASATAHNGVAALLVVTLVCLLYRIRGPRISTRGYETANGRE